MQWKVEKQGPDGLTVGIQGGITEDADFRPILKIAGGQDLHLELSGVESINSCGVREWIHFVKNLEPSVQSLTFHRCSPAIVRQLNMIANFRGSSDIQSVLLPYYCPDCSKEVRTELTLGSDRSIPEVIPCPLCGGEAEFDDLPDSFLAFAE